MGQRRTLKTQAVLALLEEKADIEQGLPVGGNAGDLPRRQPDGSVAWASLVVRTASAYVQPAADASVTVVFTDTASLAVGQSIFIETGGAYEVTSIINEAAANITNLGAEANAAPGTNIPIQRRVTGGGSTGATGPQGQPGVDGRTIYNGAGAPSGALGANGDFYIDNTAHALYGPKTAGAWGSPFSLIGTQGPQGPAGAGSAPQIKANNSVVVAVPANIDFSTAFTVTEAPAAEANIAANFGTTAGTIAQGSALQAHLDNATGAHAASAISYATGPGTSSISVEGALDELSTEKSDTGHVHAGTDITTGTVAGARLGSGTPSANLFLRGDAGGSTWAGAPFVCTSITRPGSPHTGMMISETDTGLLLVNTGTSGSPVWLGPAVHSIPFVDGRATGTIAVGDIPLRWQAENNIVIVGIRANLFTAGSTSTIGDLKRATVATPGTLTSLYTTNTKPTITSSNFGSGAAALPNTVNIDQGEWLVGNINTLGTGAGGFTLQVQYRRRG